MSPASDPTPVRVGARYRLDERIGAGAMGAVWRSTDELLNRTVAVKELLKAAAPPTAAGKDELEESRQRILREGRIGARLQHPHVISMFDVVVHDDRPWLVMEYLPSRSLAQVLGDGPLSPIEAADIGRQVADGLAAAHAAGVVHRDVKPGNVLIAEDGRVKLTDFGVSRAVDDVQLTRTGLIAGTPAFLSPEVARGLEPTAASDVFALGATLYASVEGRPPFGLDDNAYALLHKVATENVRPPRDSGPVADVIMRLLSRDPEDRPSAAEAREALAAAAAGRDTGMTPLAPAAEAGVAAAATKPARTRPARPKPPTVSNLSRPVAGRRNRLRIVLGALGVLVVVAGITAVVLMETAGAESDGPLAAQAPTSSVPAPATDPSVDPTPTTAPQPTTTAPPAATSAAPTSGSEAGSVDGDAVGFVQSYYGLLPGNPDEAWEMLGPDAREASNGRDGFESFYAGIESVSLQDARQTGENTVEGTVVFDPREGATTRERYRFVLSGGPEGQMIMESFSTL